LLFAGLAPHPRQALGLNWIPALNSQLPRLQTLAAALTRLRFSHNVAPLSALAVLLGGFGAVAVAVSPLTASDDTPIVRRLVIEQVGAGALSAQLEALAEQDLDLRRSGITRDGDSVTAVLRRLGVQDGQALAALNRDETLRDALNGAGRFVQARSARNGQLIDLVVHYPAEDAAQLRSHFSRLTIARSDQGWASQVETRALVTETRRAGARVRSSFRVAANEAGLPSGIAAQLCELLAADVGGQREPRPGESFSVLYEDVLADGEPVRWSGVAGRVLAAEVSGAGGGASATQVIWFEEPGSVGSYYDGKGRPKPQGFMAAPLQFDRVTSGFELRIDPFLRRTAAHQGVDYAAPEGTPVYSVAPGIVEFAGRQSGYGNVVEVRHSAERTTLYAHLSRIDVAQGDPVQQGRMVGAVGRTGWATGPHLHFEYRVGGVYQDPQLATRTLAQATLVPAARRQFEQVARDAKVQLDAALAVGARRASFE
jgi:murein DD-endopeptidase MepM/ murein hydrolase activator NlpD